MLASATGHQFATSLIYAAPAWNGRRWYVKQPFGGWQISGIYQHRGGLPFSVSSSQTMNDDINGSRANLTLANGPAALPGSDRNFDRWFNTAAFTTPADYTWGNSGMNILRGPGFSELEFALEKSFLVSEGKSLTFRAETTNALNHVNLGQPSATLGAAGFGTIRGINGDPRIMQMVLKFAF